ncbi:hypothetical protein RvY_07247 [Ramazzottius varieornatus]|uniref:Uncharacterized protein n=1 Tax=Ramazzottius varieornatus TaxID=947166 RepID=A0A1D1V1D6_RAMVA|nr:hypothetical protein RvY_07247 [Ramazzottius varieornatus]
MIDTCVWHNLTFTLLKFGYKFAFSCLGWGTPDYHPASFHPSARAEITPSRTIVSVGLTSCSQDECASGVYLHDVRHYYPYCLHNRRALLLGVTLSLLVVETSPPVARHHRV